MKFVLSSLILVVIIGLVAGQSGWDRRPDRRLDGRQDRRPDGRLGGRPEERLVECNTHSDCPGQMNCYTDFKCREPCDYSMRCGIGATCSVVEKVPSCYCPPGFEGDATKECFNTGRGQRHRYNY